MADQALKRQKVAWLLVEQELVDADIAIKTALSSQVAINVTFKTVTNQTQLRII